MSLRGGAQADILLLGGDLYHDNKPSRQCMVKSMKLFKRYVLGDRCPPADKCDRFPQSSDARLARGAHSLRGDCCCCVPPQIGRAHV